LRPLPLLPPAAINELIGLIGTIEYEPNLKRLTDLISAPTDRDALAARAARGGGRIRLALAVTEPFRGAPRAIQQKRNAALAMRWRFIAVLRREDIHHSDGLAGIILDRRRERTAAGENLTFALGEAALADRADLAPKHGLIVIVLSWNAVRAVRSR